MVQTSVSSLLALWRASVHSASTSASSQLLHLCAVRLYLFCLRLLCFDRLLQSCLLLAAAGLRIKI